MTQQHDLPWPETLATVTACTYRFGSLAVMAFGIPDRNHFVIGFSYRVARTTYTGTFTSAIALPQGDTLTITYNPRDPRENSKSRLRPQ